MRRALKKNFHKNGSSKGLATQKSMWQESGASRLCFTFILQHFSWKNPRLIISALKALRACRFNTKGGKSSTQELVLRSGNLFQFLRGGRRVRMNCEICYCDKAANSWPTRFFRHACMRPAPCRMLRNAPSLCKWPEHHDVRSRCFVLFWGCMLVPKAQRNN